MHKLLLLAFFLEIFAFSPKKPITVFMAGDSTMANKPLESPERGWGQLFPLMFDETVRIDNRGANGRSTKTFILENRWQAIMDTIRPGDYVFIQFGHNDQAKDKPERYTPPDEYKANLIRFVQETRAKKAKPVLCTPVARRNFDAQGKVTNPHGVYPDLVKEVAAAYKVPMIDMFQKTKKLAESYGPEVQRFDNSRLAPPPALAAPLRPMLARARIWMPILGAALPAKLALAGFLFYLVPLALHEEGYGSSATGRALLLYFLLAAATNPLGSWLSDRFGWNRRLVIGGGLLIGAGGLTGLLGGPGAATLAIAICFCVRWSSSRT